MGFTLLAVLDEYGEFLGEFRLPFALTEEQKSTLRHGSECVDTETYFWVDHKASFDDDTAVDMAQQMIAEMHVNNVKKDLFNTPRERLPIS